MALRNHTAGDIRSIRDRVRFISDTLDAIAREMDELNSDGVKFQSESVLNHRLIPLEDWIYRVRGEAEKQLRKLRREREAFQLGQQYAASKSAEKPQKTPGKRGGSGGGKR